MEKNREITSLVLGPSLYQGSTVTGWVYSTEADQRVRFTRSQLYTAISRKVVGKMCRRQSRKIIWDTINHCSWHCSCRTYFCYLPFALANICPWSLVPFSQISLKNSELRTGQNSFRDCRLHFFRQPFSNICISFVANLWNLLEQCRWSTTHKSCLRDSLTSSRFYSLSINVWNSGYVRDIFPGRGYSLI